MADWLRTLIRSWLGVDDDRTRTEAVLYQHARSLGQIRQDIVGIRFDIGERGKAIYLGRDDRPYTAEERRRTVDGLLGEDPNGG